GVCSSDLKEYAATYNSMTDSQADKLMSNYMDFQKDKLNLEKDYVKKFKKILPTRKVARYFQLEHKLDAVIDYDLARAIPLLQYEPPSGRAPAQADIEQAGETLAVPFSPEALVEVAGWIGGEVLLYPLTSRDCRESPLSRRHQHLPVGRDFGAVGHPAVPRHDTGLVVGMGQDEIHS